MTVASTEGAARAEPSSSVVAASPADPVTIVRDGTVAVVTIDNPPSNALVGRVRAALLLAIAETEADRGVRAVVLRGAGATFVPGLDLAPLDRVPARPVLAEVIRAIEEATKPWVAAIEGAATGSGLELALGCHYRLATPDARLSLPEVTLGLVPAAGGIVRLCRLVAPLEALAMAAEGRVVTGDRAGGLGLVDALVDGPLRAAAVVFAGEAPRRELRLPVSAFRPVGAIDATFETAAARVVAEARGAEAPGAAVAAIRGAHALDFHDSLAAERGRHGALLGGAQSRALRYVACAEEALLARVGPAPLPTATVGVVGGGSAAGADVAAAALLSGRRVLLVDRAEKALARGFAAIGALLDAARDGGVIDARAHGAALGRLDGGTAYGVLAGADIVVVAAIEDERAGSDILAALERATPPGAVIAIAATLVASAVAGSGRVVAMRFAVPPPAARLAELARTEAVRRDVLATAVAFARDLGRLPVVGSLRFIGDRLLAAYTHAMEALLVEGASPRAIDAAMEGFGMASGPDAIHAPLGRDHERGGFGCRTVGAAEIRRWALAAMVQEGARLLSEGIAARPSDIDLVAVHGLGFPRWRGGPMHWADAEGTKVVAATIDGLAVNDPHAWAVPPTLRRLAAEGRPFADLDG